ncbi:hypothetical protein Z945_2535 [Sulfitobacter noctilucae]|nr:hypothetical protein Z945_2535 [Sulfitobacter noctilucae]
MDGVLETVCAMGLASCGIGVLPTGHTLGRQLHHIDKIAAAGHGI